MITRKAIIAAFETITGDKSVKSVTIFCPDRPRVSTFKMQRVRVTREAKNPTGYRVQLGRMNYAERRYVEQQISKTHQTPRVWVRYR